MTTLGTMFPDLDEQQRLLETPAEELFPLLRKGEKEGAWFFMVAGAVYDLREVQPVKAAKLVELAVAAPDGRIFCIGMAAVLALIHDDRDSNETDEAYVAFCRERGVEKLPEGTSAAKLAASYRLTL